MRKKRIWRIKRKLEEQDARLNENQIGMDDIFLCISYFDLGWGWWKDR